MAEPESLVLPFDPSEPPPEITGELSDEERTVAAAHAHYYHTRQALDLIDTSRYQAMLVPGVDPDLLDDVEMQAQADQQLGDDESAGIVDATDDD